MFINWKLGQIHLNIVYYGPALSGKTTNLEQIHALTHPSVRSELFTLNTHQDRTIFFDFLQLDMGRIGKLQPKFGLYTVPGQVYYEATRAAVLRRADGVVFVADSQASRLGETIQSWRNMEKHLAQKGLRPGTLPLVVQFNKRDLPAVLPVGELVEALHSQAYPCYEAVAIRGVGVPETLQAAIRLVLVDVQRKMRARVQQGQA
ncbi:MAG: GTPase domain-containing protein [Chloroflexia bacterium]|nr:GTPase domain-containing protein [Chloroflexia bacterium]